MEAMPFSEISRGFHYITRRHIPEHWTSLEHDCAQIRSDNVGSIFTERLEGRVLSSGYDMPSEMYATCRT